MMESDVAESRLMFGGIVRLHSGSRLRRASADLVPETVSVFAMTVRTRSI